jgi:RimJ/RimL family protein N-acetyltransferase
MRHEITIEGFSFRLRPITNADAAFIIELRTDPEHNRYLHAISNRIDDQEAWLASYYDRTGDYYFVIERLDSGAAEGAISIYNIDPQSNTGEWGRWILKPGSLAAIESALLIYRVAFEAIGLNSVYCLTVADNAKVVSFHDSCGIVQRQMLPQHFEICGQRLDAVEHRVTRTNWPEIAQRLEKLSKIIARRAVRG